MKSASHGWKRWRRRFWTAALLFVMLLALVLGFVQTPWGKAILAEQLSALVASHTRFALRIEGVSGLLPRDIHVDRIELDDVRGPVLALHDVHARLSLRDLFLGKIHVRCLTVAHAEIWRRPVPKERFRVPRLPAWLNWSSMEEVHLERISLAQAVAGAPAELTLSGRIEPLPGWPMPRLSVDIQGVAPTGLDAQITVDVRDGAPYLQASVQDHDWLCGLLQIEAPMSLSINGSGSRADWQANLRAASATETLTEGSLHFAEAEETAVTATLTAYPGRIPALHAYVPATGAEIGVKLGGALNRQGVFTLQETAIASPVFRLTASGTVSLPERQLDLALNAAHDNLYALSERFPENMAGQAAFTLQGPAIAPDLAWTTQLGAIPILTGQAHLELGPEIRLAGNTVLSAPPEMRVLLPQLPDGELAVAFDLIRRGNPSRIEIAALSATLPGAALTLGGTIQEDGAAFSLTAELKASDMAPLAGAFSLDAQGAGTVRLDAEGAGDEAHYTGSLHLDKLHCLGISLEDAQWESNGAATHWRTPASATLEAAIALNAASFQWGSVPAMPITLRSDVSMKEAGRLDFSNATLTDGNIALSGSGHIEPMERRFAWDTEVQVSALERMPLPLPGAITGQGAATVALEGGWAPFHGMATFSGALGKLNGLPAVVQACVKEQLPFSGQVRMEKGSIEVLACEIRAESCVLSGTGAFNTDAHLLNAQAKVDLSDLSRMGSALKREVAGRLTASVDASGTWPRLKVVVDADGSNLRYAGSPLLAGQARLESAALPEQPEAIITGMLRDGDRRASLDSKCALKDERLTLSSLTLKTGDNQLVGKGAMDLASGIITAEANLALNDLQDISAWVGGALSGKASGSVKLTERTLRLSLDAEQIQWDTLTLKQASLSSTINDCWGQPSGEGVLSVSQLQRGPIQVGEAALRATGAMEAIQLALNAEGVLNNKTAPPPAFSCQMESTLAPRDRQLSVTLLKGKVMKTDYSLAEPLSLGWTDRAYVVPTASLRIGDGQAHIGGRIGPDVLECELRAEALPMTLTQVFLALPLAGTLDGKAFVGGTPDAPELSVEGAFSEIRLDQESARGFTPLSAVLKAAYAGNNAQMTLNAEMKDILKLDAQGAFPLDWQLWPMSLMLPPDGRVKGDAAMTLAFNPLLEAFGLVEHHFDGVMNAQFQWDGVMDAPNASGAAVIEKGRYEYARTGAVLDQLEMKVTADGARLRLETCRATTDNDGSIEATGELRLLPEEHFPMEATVRLNNAQFARLSHVNGRMSGVLTAQGALDGMRLSGDITVDKLNLSMPEQLPVKEPPTVDVVEIRDNEIETPLGPPPRRLAALVALDIRCAIPDRMYMRAPILDSQWGGQLHITGSLAEPLVGGRIAVAQGYLEFLSRRFVLQDSAILFLGGAPTAPWLDMHAAANTPAVTARLSVTGDLSDIKLDLSSDPALPQDEVLAQVLFGKDIAHISPVQAIQLARIAAMFNRGLASLQVFSGNIGLPGIDRLDIRTGERADETVVGIGKYFTDSIYVEVEQGAASDSSKVSVEVEVTPRISVKGDVDARERSGVGLFWKKDY